MPINEENIDLWSKFETIDFETGELVNVLDNSTPVRNRVDSAKWLIDRFNAEIELCKERKKLWNERQRIFLLAIDRIKERILEDMLAEKAMKVKTLENTVFISQKQVTSYDEDKVLPEHKQYELILKNLDIDTFNKLVALSDRNSIKHESTASVDVKLLPADLIQWDTVKYISFRKSPKSVK